MFKVDVFVSRGRPFDRSAAERARPQTIGDHTDTPCLVASAEDTILARLEWFRRGGETSERQWWDIAGVLRVGTDIEGDYLRRWAEALGVTDLLQRAFADAGSSPCRKVVTGSTEAARRAGTKQVSRATEDSHRRRAPSSASSPRDSRSTSEPPAA